MKREDLEALGLSKEQVDKVLDAHHAELGPVQKELETAKEDLKTVKETVDTQKTTIEDLKKDLEDFKDADVSGMKQKITDLETAIQNKETEYTQQIPMQPKKSWSYTIKRLQQVRLPMEKR